MVILTAIGNFFKFIFKHPTAALLVVASLLALLLVWQWQSNKTLKAENKAKDEALKREEQRSINNLKALQDTITYLKDEQTYTKRVLAAKQGEVEHLDRELAAALANVKTIVREKEVPKFVYITDINSNVSTVDVQTKVDVRGDSISLGLTTTNDLFTVNTDTWFSLLPDTTKQQLNLQFLNKYGVNRPSKVDVTMNFKLRLVQTESEDGSKRVYIQPTDSQGNPISPDLLNIGNVKGVDFVDVVPTTKEAPKVKKPRVVMALGPQGGVTVLDGKVKPYAGFGVTIGLNLLR